MDREHVVIGGEGQTVPLVLLADVTERVPGPFLVCLVDRDQVGEIEHVDLLQLGGSAVLGGHHVNRHVRVVDDLGVGLPDPGSLQQHEVEPGGLDHFDGALHMRREGEVGLTGRQRSHVRPGMGKGVQPDPVTEQGASRPPLRRVHRDHRNLEIVEVEEEPAQQLVDEARLPRAAGAGDPHHRG